MFAILSQVIEMRKVYEPIQEQAKASFDQAMATIVSNIAWISARVVSLGDKIQPNQPITIRIVFENSGRTPALSTELPVRGRTIRSNNEIPIRPQVYVNVNFGDNMACETAKKILCRCCIPIFQSSWIHKRFRYR